MFHNVLPRAQNAQTSTPATSVLLIYAETTHAHILNIIAKRKTYTLKDACPQTHTYIDVHTKPIANFCTN